MGNVGVIVVFFMRKTAYEICLSLVRTEMGIRDRVVGRVMVRLGGVVVRLVVRLCGVLFVSSCGCVEWLFVSSCGCVECCASRRAVVSLCALSFRAFASLSIITIWCSRCIDSCNSSFTPLQSDLAP